MISITFALLIIFITSTFLYCKWLYSHWAKRGVKTPPYNFLLGHFLRGMNAGGINREYFVDKYYREFKSEKVMGWYELNKPAIQIIDLDLIQKIMVKDFEYFVDRRNFELSNSKDKIFSEMLTGKSGMEWKNIRKVLTPTFSSGKIKQMFPLVLQKTKNVANFCENRQGQNINFVELCEKFSADVLGTCAFGIEFDSISGNNDEFIKICRIVTRFTGAKLIRILIVFFLPFIAKMFNLTFTDPELDYLVKVVEDTIAERRKNNIRRGDFIDLLLDASSDQNDSSDDKKNTFKMSDECLIAQAMLFIFGGFDTTATTMGFVLKNLAQHGKYQELIREELQQKMEDDDRKQFSYEDIMESKWLEAFVAESMRTHAVAPFTERTCSKDYQVPETAITIKKGTTIFIPIWSVHYDERYYDEPFEFRPERFLPENKGNIPSGAHLPFGIGPRNCIAQRFALMEMKMFIAELVLNYKLKCAEGFEDMKLTMVPGIQRIVEDTCQLVVEKL